MGQKTLKFKLIVEWIKKERDDNKEAIERLDKRTRDHFRHKAHKRPRKRKKDRGSTVHSTLYLLKRHVLIIASRN